MTIAVVTGTRPEIIKMYPIIKLFDSKSIDYKYIHTGQHYDYDLFLKFIEEFEIRKPDVYVSADVSSPVNQVSSIMAKMGSVISEMRPSVMLVEAIQTVFLPVRWLRSSPIFQLHILNPD